MKNKLTSIGSGVAGLLTGLLLLIWAVPVQAQSNKALMDQLVEEENEGLKALSMYPTEVRTAIFEAAQHPEVLVRMQTLQAHSSERFQQLLATYGREDQEEIYELTRYPGLVISLGEGEARSGKALDNLLADYPEEIHASARKWVKKDPQLLTGASSIFLSTEQAFRDIIRNYSEETQDAFQQLIDLPEIVYILNEDMSMTVLVGDLYRQDPEFVIRTTDSLNVALAERNASELKDWENELNNDPEAKAEFIQASEAYAEEFGYERNDYAAPRTSTTIVVNHVYYPYRYWWGYPWWYETPYWYRYPWWYDWGWYYGPGNTVVFIGMPSWHFTYWYFYYPQHHHHYSHFSSHCVRWNHHHRESPSGFNRAVRDWKTEASASLGTKWLEPDAGLPQRLNDYGKLEMDVKAAEIKQPGKEISDVNLVRENPSAYPNLSTKVETKAPVSRPSTTQPVNYAKPRNYTTPPPSKPIYQSPPKTTTPVSRPTTPTTPRKNPVDYRNITPASDYHKQQWNTTPTRTVRPSQPVSRPSSGGKSKVKPR